MAWAHCARLRPEDRSELVRRLVAGATAETLVLLTASKRAAFYGRAGFRELATKARIYM